MGVPPELAKAAIRVSFGWNTTAHDIETFIGAWRRLVDRKNKKAA
jgi:cysteine desulfurase